MFCRCENVWGEEPNTRTCPVCLAHPGTLPVPNRKAIEWTVKLGLALDCEIAARALFHRKNYFYPDLPKGYQISQYDVPLASGGRFLVPGPDGDREIGIVRAHLEEDAAKTDPRRRRRRAHPRGRVLARRLQPRRHAARRDRRRAGRPLGRGGAALPAAPAPDGRRARDLGRGDGEGLAPLRRQRLRPRGRRDRLPHEDRAQEHELVQVRRRRDRGRGRAADRRSTRPGSRSFRRRSTSTRRPGTIAALRSKEEAHDYRYFPEPDLVAVEPPAELVERRAGRDRRAAGRAHPAARARGRLRPRLRPRHERARRALRARARRRPPRGRERPHEPARRRRRRPDGGERRRAREADRGARDAFRARPFSTRSPPAAIPASRPSATSRRPRSPTPPSSTRSSSAILAANPGQVEAYRGGKEGLLGFFVGQVMKETQGKANARVVNERLREKLSV